MGGPHRARPAHSEDVAAVRIVCRHHSPGQRAARCRAISSCRSRLARSSSARRLLESPRPARLIKKSSMRRPEVGPLGLTRFEASALAMVAASLVNNPALGNVDVVVTVCTHSRPAGRRDLAERDGRRCAHARLAIIIPSGSGNSVPRSRLFGLPTSPDPQHLCHRRLGGSSVPRGRHSKRHKLLPWQRLCCGGVRAER